MRELLAILACFATGFWWMYFILFSRSMPVSLKKKIFEWVGDTLLALAALALPIFLSEHLINIIAPVLCGAVIMGGNYFILSMRIKGQELQSFGSAKEATLPISRAAILATVLIEVVLFLSITTTHPDQSLTCLVSPLIAILCFSLVGRQQYKS